MLLVRTSHFNASSVSPRTAASSSEDERRTEALWWPPGRSSAATSQRFWPSVSGAILTSPALADHVSVEVELDEETFRR